MSWLGSMIDNIAQDARQTKAVQYDQLSWIRNRKTFKRDRDVNFAREDSAIQRRVEDARKAGVHPLFALGGAVGSSPAFFMGGGSTAAQSSGGGTGGGPPDAMEVETHKAAMRESSARAAVYEKQAEREDFALQAEKASLAARLVQRSNVNQDVIKVPSQQKEYSIPPDASSPHRLFKKKGEGWRTSATAQAQNMEDEYGEISDWTYGPARALHDWYWYNEGWRMFNPYGVQERVRLDEQSRK